MRISLVTVAVAVVLLLLLGAAEAGERRERCVGEAWQGRAIDVDFAGVSLGEALRTIARAFVRAASGPRRPPVGEAAGAPPIEAVRVVALRVVV